MKKQLFLLLSALFLSVSSAFAYSFSAVAPTGQTLYYNISGDEAIVTSPNPSSWTGYTMPTGDLTIPSSVTYNGQTYSVTTFNAWTFLDCTGLTSVIIPNTITSISNATFWGCSGLTSVTIPNSVTTIGNGAFSGCSSLSTVNYTGTLEGWFGISFGNNSGSNPAGIAHGLSINGTPVTNLVIPEGVTTIADNAFKGWTSLTSVTIPNSVTTIGNNAFSGCSSLTSLTIGNGVTTIGSSAFYYCSGLTTITIPNSVTTIGNGAFYGCNALTTVNYTGTLEGWFGISFGNNSGSNPAGIAHGLSINGTPVTNLVIPEGVTTIADNAFNDWTSLTSVTIPNSVTTIGNSAFYNCSSLSTVNYTGTLEGWFGISFGNSESNPASIAHGLSINGTPVTNLVIPEGVTTIADNAFKEWTSLTSVTIPNSVTTIGNSAFYNCSGLTSVTIGSGVTSIGSLAFKNCSGLTSVAIENGTIGSSAFSDCSSLTSVTIGNGVTSIGSYAFYYCSSLTSVTIGSGVTSIGTSAFRCYALTSVNYTGTLEGWFGISFGNSESNPAGIAHGLSINGTPVTNLVIPEGVTTIADNAFNGWTSLTSVTIHNAVTSIGNSAFANCNGLNILTVPNTVQTIGNNAFYRIPVVFYYGLASGSPWGADCLNGVLGNGLTLVPFNDSLYILQVASNVTSITSSVLNISNIAAIEVDQGNNTFSSLNGVLYNKQKTQLWRCPRHLSGTVTIPTSVTSLRTEAFRDCKFVDKLVLNTSNYSIGNNCFAGTLVDTLFVGDEVDALNREFLDLEGLVAINVDPDNWSYQSVDGMLVSMDGSAILRYPRGRQGAVSIPANITHVGEKAFKDCSLLTSISLNNVTYIAREGFSGCTGLRTLTIPEAVDTIEHLAFSGNHLHTLYFNASHITYAGGSIFQSDSLYEVVFGPNVPEIPYEAFYRCRNLQVVQLPSSLKIIGSDAFAECSSLQSITLPDSLVRINAYAFDGCSSLEEITIPQRVKEIGSCAFRNCSNLHTVYYNAISTFRHSGDSYYSSYYLGARGDYFDIFREKGNHNNPATATHVNRLVVGEGVKAMYAIWAFGVDTLELPSTLDTVVFYHFGYSFDNETSELRYVTFNCRNLIFCSNYDLTDGISLSNNAYGVFPCASNLRHVIFGDSVQAIPSFCFKGCKQVRELANFVIPSSVTSIGTGAFEGCTQMRSITIPSSVTSIGAAPFLKCSNLRSLRYNSVDAVDLGDLELPQMDREYEPSTALSYQIVATRNSRSSKVSLREYIPPIDTIHIGPGVREIPSCLLGYPWNQLLDTTSNTQWTYVNNQSSVIRRIGNGAFANLNLVNAESLITDSLVYIDNGAFMNCNGLSKVFLPEGCRYVGNAAFRNIPTLDSVSLPSTVQIIGTDAFRGDSSLSYLYYDCDSAYIDFVPAQSSVPFANTPSLHTIDFGPNVRYLTECMFKNADGLERVVLPEGLIGIENECFKMTVNNPNAKIVIVSGGGYLSGNVDTSSLRYVSLPSTLQYIGGEAFNTSTYYPIDTVVCRGAIPPALENTYVYWSNGWYSSYNPVFTDGTCSDATLIVPCGFQQNYLNYSNNFYTDRWNRFSSVEESIPYEVSLTVNNDTMGTVSSACSGGHSDGYTGVMLTATPAIQHHFVQWSDGVTSNPRVIYLNRDTTLVAHFAWGNIYHITVNSSNSNRGTTTGSGNFVQNSIDTITAIPNFGYYFSHWNDGDTTNPRLLSVVSDITLTATFLPYQFYLSANSADSTQGTVTGSGTFDYHTNHSIQAYPATGYHFVSWNDGVSTNPRTVMVTSDTTFTASFAINIYSLTLNSNNSVMGHASSDTTHYPHGGIATLFATPNYGYHFTAWSDGDTANPRTIVLTQNLSLTAIFDFNQYSISDASSSGRGSVSGTGYFNYLSNQSVTAIPNYGYHFTGWSDGDTTNPRSFILTQDTVFTAIFDYNDYHVSLSTNDNERGSVSGSGIILFNHNTTISATPADGYQFVSWNDCSTLNPRTIAVTQDTAFSAIFATLVDTMVMCPDAFPLTYGNTTFNTNTQEGDYPVRFSTIQGCDSTVTLTLQFHPTYRHNDSLILCYSMMPYNYEGHILNTDLETGNYDIPLRSALGCDSTIALNLTVHASENTQLCMVSVEEGLNLLRWNKEVPVEYYKIYREGITAGEYDLMDSVPSSDPAYWVDQESNPRARSYRYRISSVDSCGNESELSNIHKTMHLTISRGLNNSWNLVWTEYEGTSYSTYKIYRGTNPSDLTEIDVIPAGGNTTYTDENAPSSGSVYYQVGILLNQPCSETKSADLVLSNQATNSSMVDIRSAILDNATISTDNGQIVVSNAANQRIRIFDSLGRLISTTLNPEETAVFNMPASGVYMVQIGDSPAQRVVVVK